MRKRALIHCYNLIRGAAYLERGERGGSKSSMAHISMFRRNQPPPRVVHHGLPLAVVAKWLVGDVALR